MRVKAALADGARQGPVAQDVSRLIMPALILGIFMRALQMTMFGPSLVNIAQSLGASLAEIGWIIAAYATGALIAQPIVGRLSDAKGRKAVFAAAVVLFGLGSLVCAFATTLPVLVAGRIVQAIGAGGIQPAATAIIGDRLPKARQGAALGAVFGMFAVAGVIGPVLGGVLIDGGRRLAASVSLGSALHHELATYPWHLIFWVNIPLALATLVLAMRMPADDSPKEPIGFDIGGMVLLAAFSACIMLAATSGALPAIAWTAAALLCIAGLAVWERAAPAPLIDPSLFAQRGPALTYVIAFISGVPVFSVMVYSAAYVMAQFGSTATQSGMMLLVLAVLLGLGSFGGGKLINRLGAKAIMSAGMASLCVGSLLFGLLPSLSGVVAAMAFAGLGMGLASAPPNALVMSYVASRRRGAATGLMTMFATSGSVTAPAVVSAFLHNGRGGVVADFRAEFILCAFLALLCAGLTGLLPRPVQQL
ncbi:MAG: MFS transporter [Candidatus Eremiobacteraeota bacterium]|nr:MFS transporter [Candidatus Eremiobacteraeota bacterium]MBC5826687.1 MFS transporter [Candidatus Eremiobacteraeota bacterium]